MYTDPCLIRNNRINLRLNDVEADLLDAVTNFTGQQKGALIRELLLEQARLVLAGQADYAPRAAENEAPQSALFGAAKGAA